ncbi:hypothetical protein D9757_010370 [Collybiopsis confluens]|uniref:Uncharacterized protein n=1 Tax=Collybiopsis confluens TaxID=2823264 RepID=A0A8H5LVX5_9AGAR|nr:hypothetical protein D9757_010370 [Collybiopsis confluens]
MPNEASQSLAMIPEPMRIARDGRRKEMERSYWAGCRGKEEEGGDPKLRISLNRTSAGPFEMKNARASSRECTIVTAIDCMSLPNFPGRNKNSHPASNTLDEDDGASILSPYPIDLTYRDDDDNDGTSLLPRFGQGYFGVENR